MNIAIVCIDTRGGVQPYLGLAVGLQNAGHSVRFIAPANYEKFVTARGVAFKGLSGDLMGAIHHQGSNGRGTDKGFLQGHLLMIRTVSAQIIQWTAEVYDACQGVDAILSGFGGMLAAESVAEKLGIPLLQAHVQPLTPTSSFRGLIKPIGLPNRLSHRLGRQAFWQPLRMAINKARRSVLGIGKSRFFGMAGRTSDSTTPLLYGYSPSLLPKPIEWPANVHVTGYWFLKEESTWQPPVELVRFLKSGEKPVLIGFGSMASSDAASTDELLSAAIRLSGQRSILVSGWSKPERTDLTDRIFRIDSVPYGWLMPRVSAVVHHGGAGTTGAALAAGVPSIIVPHTADQPFWGDIIASRTLGICPIPRKRLSAERLAGAIRTVVEDDRYRQNTEHIASKMAEEDGVRTAVQILEKWMAQN
jgi:sterol 3beta-glucosyltransferase